MPRTTSLVRAARGPAGLVAVGRVLARVELDPESECWNMPSSYAGVSVPGLRIVRAHRFMFVFYTGLNITRNDLVHHKCRNDRCVNPDHLRMVAPVTHRHLHVLPEDPPPLSIREIRTGIEAIWSERHPTREAVST